MDYTYYGAAPHAYAFTGLPSTTYPHGLDQDINRSIEPLDANFLPYDAFPFTPNLPPSHGSPDTLGLPTSPQPIANLENSYGGDMEDGRAQTTRSSSEEREAANLTPAQSRRKAQNRAAQRAFRERKERHVRDLEAKLTHLESSTHSLQSDNDRLKLALQRARTENEILRATTGPSPTHSRPGSMIYPEPGAHLPPENLDDDEPYNVQSLSNGSLVNAADKDHTAMRRKAKGKDVPAAKMWDVIQSHPLIQRGLVDVADVCERLRGVAKCDGAGPVFDETIIYAAIESARRSGGDTLI